MRLHEKTQIIQTQTQITTSDSSTIVALTFIKIAAGQYLWQDFTFFF